MKAHYINILLLALPLNILAHNKNKIYIAPHHTQTNRTLCECDLYMPNYESDPQMKEVMEQFVHRTSHRFHEYDERMKTTRQKCKEQCDKEIQKIILKDKLEKELTEKLSTLHTDISTDDIPTCVCEKSVADKTEKFCLNCGKTVGGVAPGWGLVSGIIYTGWKTTALAAATQKGIEDGISVVIETLKGLFHINGVTDLKWKTLITAENYTDHTLVGAVIKKLNSELCVQSSTGIDTNSFCLFTYNPNNFTRAINRHVASAISKGTEEVVNVTQAEIGKVTSTSFTYSTAIIASVVAIVVIVLIMVIIYLILRYKRKRKMKKKLQYIKLLEE
ncbi:rifin [Plasmodium reichenowi]|uniref:Rifin n=1 Tax=Plasmodium reichenowi TaxID=5854 RepID=A0A060RLY6_PLARE|nr:rifin [Plasmodium reichenowi]